MPSARNSLVSIVVAIAATFISCRGETVYSTYVHTASEGWLRSAPMVYVVDSIPAGNYYVETGLRITKDYPFTSITLTVARTIPSLDAIQTDTVTIDVSHREGQALGCGITYYTFTASLRPLNLSVGDSLSVSISHCMSADTVLGVTDVGLIIIKRNNLSS